MKRIIAILLCSIFFQFFLAVETIGQVNYGTYIPARLIDKLDSESPANVTSANLVVASDIYSHDQIYIKRDTKISNRLDITRRRGVGKPGKIEITAISTTDIEGKTMPLYGTFVVEGKSNKGLALGVGLGLGLGTILVPMLGFLAKKGEPAYMKQNTLINDFYVAQ